MDALTTEQVYFCLLVGIIPALLWLFFWLREDSKRPEPRGLIMATFVAGMVMVPVAGKLQEYLITPNLFDWFTNVLPPQPLQIILDNADSIKWFAWAAVEELLKFGIAWIIALRLRVVDEPIDAVIYMLTVALGFVALENTLFMLKPDDLLHYWIKSDALITGNIRFIGSSLLHTVTSGVVGIFIALAFYKDKFTKILYLLLGLTTAIVLHTEYNLFIIRQNDTVTFQVFGTVWFAIVILMLFFEKIKRIYPVNKI